MDIEVLKAHIKPLMKSERYKHCIGVAELGGRLAEIYGADGKKAVIAGILHDCAKEFDNEKMHLYLNRSGADRLVLKTPKLWHGPAGAVYAKDKFNIDDEIYDAIYYHTIGKEEMSLLTKIIFLADCIEVNRDSEFDWAGDMRILAEKNLDAAVLKVVEKNLISLIERGYSIHTNSVLCRNRLISADKKERV